MRRLANMNSMEYGYVAKMTKRVAMLKIVTGRHEKIVPNAMCARIHRKYVKSKDVLSAHHSGAMVLLGSSVANTNPRARRVYGNIRHVYTTDVLRTHRLILKAKRRESIAYHTPLVEWFAYRKKELRVLWMDVSRLANSFDLAKDMKAFCESHREDEMVSLAVKICTYPSCRTTARFNFEGEKGGIFCKVHRHPSMASPKMDAAKTCRFPSCGKRAHYNHIGEKTGIYCASHKEPFMRNIADIICRIDGCEVRATFNYNGEKHGMYCRNHALENMSSVYVKKCLLCPKAATFNFGGHTRPAYCKDHKPEGAIDVAHKRCSYGSCLKLATHNFEGATGLMFCATHRHPSMQNIRAAKCTFQSCTTRASFGNPGDKRGTFCALHALTHHVNVLDRRTCAVDGCMKTPGFNYPGEKNGLYCAPHSLDCMTDIRKRTCIHNNCTLRAGFGIPGRSPTHCFSHKSPSSMIADPSTRCKTQGCKEMAFYGTSKLEHCEAHRTPEEGNFVEQKCNSCGLQAILDTKGVCEFCNPSAFKTAYLAKQRTVESFLISNNYEFKADSTIDKGECGRERPDFLFLSNRHAVIVEVDENQHLGRSCECEQTRMINIWQSLAMPTFFIRYNPDTYKKPGGRKRCDHESQTKRHHKLKEWIDYALSHNPHDNGNAVEVVHLFFDSYRESDTFSILQKLE